jgi:hypothetical protein
VNWMLLCVLFKVVQEVEIFWCMGLDHECVIVAPEPIEGLLGHCDECCFLKGLHEGGSSHQ